MEVAEKNEQSNVAKSQDELSETLSDVYDQTKKLRERLTPVIQEVPGCSDPILDEKINSSCPLDDFLKHKTIRLLDIRNMLNVLLSNLQI